MEFRVSTALKPSEPGSPAKPDVHCSVTNAPDRAASMKLRRCKRMLPAYEESASRACRQRNSKQRKRKDKPFNKPQGLLSFALDYTQLNRITRHVAQIVLENLAGDSRA